MNFANGCARLKNVGPRFAVYFSVYSGCKRIRMHREEEIKHSKIDSPQITVLCFCNQSRTIEKRRIARCFVLIHGYRESKLMTMHHAEKSEHSAIDSAQRTGYHFLKRSHTTETRRNARCFILIYGYRGFAASASRHQIRGFGFAPSVLQLLL